MKIKTVEQFRVASREYFNEQKDAGRPPTVAGLALALGTTRERLLKLDKPSLVSAAEEALTYCEAFAEEKLLEGKNISGVMFALKNNFNWREKNEYAHSENNLEIVIKHPWEENGDAYPN